MRNNSILKLTVKYLIVFGVLLVISIHSAEAVESSTVNTLTIMNFTNRGTEWNWLCKGLADALITDLSNCRELQVIERERMQKLFEEMTLSTTGLINEATALQFGRVAKVDKALFGSFLREGDNLSIEAHIIEVATGELVRVEWVKGKAEDLFKLEKELAFKIIDNLHIKLTEAERESIRYIPTDSIPAFEHYCRHLDFFDNGQWFDALLECRLAVRQDANYIKAHAKVAELYEDIGEPEHALVEYQDIVKADEDNTYPEYIYYKMGRLLEDNFNDDDAAIVLYEKILLRHPEYNIPYDFTRPIEKYDFMRPIEERKRISIAQLDSIMALERLALIQEKKNKPFEAAQLLSKIVYYMRTHIFTSGYPWGDLHERVFRNKYTPLYWQFVRENRDIALCPPHEVFRIPQNGIADIKIAPKEGESHINYWVAMGCIAPPDKEIAEVNFNINTNTAFVNEDGSSRTIIASVMEPLINITSQSHAFRSGNGWQKVNFKMKPGVRALSVYVQDAARWDATIKCRDWAKAVKPVLPSTVYVRVNAGWEAISFNGAPKMPTRWAYDENGEPMYTYKGQPVFLMSFNPGEHKAQIYWPDGRCETMKFYVEPDSTVELFFDAINSDQSFYHKFSQHGSNLNLFVDSHQKIWLLWDEAYKIDENFGLSDEPDQESDLFYAVSTDGKNWSKPKRLQLSSSLLDMKPILQQDRTGTYWLIWISSRDTEDPQRLWIASSANGKKWTFPRKVTLPVTEEDIERAREENYPSFAFTTDNRNTFWLVWQERLFKSDDAKEWKEAEDLSSANGLELSGSWGGFGEYSLNCDRSNHLLLMAEHKENWGTNLGDKFALWRRGNIGKWEFLGFIAEEDVRSFCINADGKHIVVLVDKGNEGLLLRAYDDILGWSEFKKIDNAPEFSSNNSIACLGEKKYIAAYCGEQDIIVSLRDGVNLYKK